jgi:hypothetical protein
MRFHLVLLVYMCQLYVPKFTCELTVFFVNIDAFFGRTEKIPVTNCQVLQITVTCNICNIKILRFVSTSNVVSIGHGPQFIVLLEEPRQITRITWVCYYSNAATILGIFIPVILQDWFAIFPHAGRFLYANRCPLISIGHDSRWLLVKFSTRQFRTGQVCTSQCSSVS